MRGKSSYAENTMLSERGKKLVARKKRGNDAIPTWSGFNYQGKITLLCVLSEINSLIKDGHSSIMLDDCYVEIEKTEDFVFYIKNKVHALYQVKAYLSNSKVSSFVEAMDKLIEHRSNLKELTAKCYICTPLSISDWNETGNTHKGIISEFFYDGKNANVTDVADKIKEELRKLSFEMKYTFDKVDKIYLALCDFLDRKVALMHREKAEKRNYNIYFNEIISFIDNAAKGYQFEQEAEEKEKIYEHIISNFKNVIDEFCDNDCELKATGVCKKEIYGSCALTTCFDYILEINIWEYCKYLNPHIISGWERQLNYVSRLREEDFKNLLIPIFLSIQEERLETDNELIYCSTSIFETLKNRVIPTLLTFDSGVTDMTKSVADKLTKIKQNTFLSSSISGSAITADTKGYSYDTQQNSILFFCKDENSILENDNYIKIVDSKDFMKRIGDVK